MKNIPFLSDLKITFAFLLYRFFVKRKLWASSRMFGNLDHIEVREAGGSLIVRKKLVFRQSLFYNFGGYMVDIWTKYRQTDR